MADAMTLISRLPSTPGPSSSPPASGHSGTKPGYSDRSQSLRHHHHPVAPQPRAIAWATVCRTVEGDHLRMVRWDDKPSKQRMTIAHGDIVSPGGLLELLELTEPTEGWGDEVGGWVEKFAISQAVSDRVLELGRAEGLECFDGRGMVDPYVVFLNPSLRAQGGYLFVVLKLDQGVVKVGARHPDSPVPGGWEIYSTDRIDKGRLMNPMEVEAACHCALDFVHKTLPALEGGAWNAAMYLEWVKGKKNMGLGRPWVRS
jgi:hypothetical protein